MKALNSRWVRRALTVKMGLLRAYRVVAWAHNLERTAKGNEPVAVGRFQRKGAERRIGEVLESEYFFY